MRRRAFRLAALAVAAACVHAVPGSIASSGDAPPEKTTGETFALLIGCSAYPFLEKELGKERYRRDVELRGPVADVVLMRTVLEAHVGVAADRIETLAGWDESQPLRNPTRRNVLRSLVRLSRDATRGSRVLVYFSGHGSQEPDSSGDEEDGLDEVMLPADARSLRPGDTGIPGGISDDELGERLRAIRESGAHVFLVMDCCHAGTMARGGDGGLRMRGIRPQALGIPAASARPVGATARGGEAEALRGVSALYAARADERAAEAPLPRDDPAAAPHGLLTWCLASELGRTRGTGAWREIAARVASHVRSLGIHGAHAFAEGALDAVLGGQDVDDLGLRPAWKDGSIVRIGAGAVDGFAKGARVAITLAGRERDSSPPVHATIEVSGVSESGARVVGHPFAGIADGRGHPAPLSARLVASPADPGALRLAVVGADGRGHDANGLPPAIRAVLADGSALWRFPLVPDVASSDWLLVVDGDATSLRPTRLVSGDDTPFDVDATSLLGVLAQVARVENLVRLATDPTAASAAPGFRASVEWKDATAPVLHPGDRVRFVARNESKGALDVWMFVLDAARGVTCVFPHLDQSARLEPGAPPAIVEGDANDDTLGEEHLLAIAIPARAGELPADLRWLEAPPLERAKDRPRGAAGGGALGERLAAAAFGDDAPPVGARGAGGVDEGLALLRSWTTAWPRVEAPASFPTTPVDVEPRRPAPRDGPPDLRDAGPRLALAKSTATARGFDLLLGGDARPDTVLVALDSVAADLATFRPSIGLRFGDDHRIAAYDRDDDGAFDLVLVEHDSDASKNERWTRAGTVWRVDRGRRIPWLRIAYLDAARYGDEKKARALAIVRGLAVP